MAAGHAGAYLHTMADLQVYQTNLLSELDSNEGFNPEAVAEGEWTKHEGAVTSGAKNET